MAKRRRQPGKPTLVITGISGRLGRLLARRLHKNAEIIGIDRRGARHLPKNVKVFDIDVRRKACEDIFRRNKVDSVIHLNILHDPRKSVQEHHDFNVVGTHKVMEYSVKHGVKKFILLSSADVYGAKPGNNQFLFEESPLMGASNYNAMRDLVEIDIYSTSFFWRFPNIDTVVLRPVHIVGHVNNAPSNYLRLKYPVSLLGFDPMVQIIHVEDVVEAIEKSLKPGIRGVFNITGPGAIALSVLQRQLGRKKVPVPEAFARRILQTMWDLRLTTFPPAELDFIKFVCMVDGGRAREVLGYRPKKSLRETIESVRY